MRKRVISFLLVLMMVISLLPMSVFAVSNAKTVKAGDAASEPKENESTETVLPGNPDGQYTVTIINDSSSSNESIIGETKYTVKVGDEEKTVSLATGESVSFKINEGDSYGVTYAGTSSRFKNSFQGVTVSTGSVEVVSINKDWTHTLGQDLTNTLYYSEKEPDTIIGAADREVDQNGNMIKTDTIKTFSMEFEESGSWIKTYTCILTNDADPEEIYTGKKSSLAGGKNGAIKAAEDAANTAFTEAYSFYSAYEKDEKYIIAEKLASRTEVTECPAADVVLAFRSEMTPVTGNMSINVYGPGIDDMVQADPLKDVSINIFNLQQTFQDISAGLANSLSDITEPTPKAVLKLVEVEGQDDYAGREYTLIEDDSSSMGDMILGLIPEEYQSLLDGIDSTFISRKYVLPEDILAGDYTLTVESIDPAGVVLKEPEHRSIQITIEQGDNKVEPEEQYLLKSDLLNWLISLIGSGNNETINSILNLVMYKGLFTVESGEGFCFTKVDVADDPLSDAEFMMVNRDETKKIIDYCFDLGKDTFVRVITNMADEEVFNWEEVVTLHTQLLEQDEENNLSLNMEAVTKLIGTYIALITTVDGQKMDLNDPSTITENLPVLLNWEELRTLKIPAILRSTSDEDGRVEWNKSSNVTLTLFTDIVKTMVPQLVDAIQKLGGSTDADNTDVNDLADASGDSQVNVLETILNLVMNDDINNGVVYNIFWRMGILTDKLPAGNYIMFESKAPENHLRNPMFYTVIVEWKDDDWVYASCADAGILLPYVAEDYYAFMRTHTIAGTTDKMIAAILKPFAKEGDAYDYEHVYSNIVNDNTDVTADMIVYTSQILYKFGGGSMIYKSADALAADMMKYLYTQGRTTQNLMIFVHNVYTRTQGVITGEMNEDWHVYNFEASIFKTWQKSLNAVTKALADSIVVGNEAEQYEAVQRINDKVQEDSEAADQGDGTDDAEPAAQTTGIVDITAFKDLNPARWYYKAVEWALTNQVMVGVTTTDFRTATPVTRAMAVTVLYVAAGKPEYSNGTGFEDVSEKRYYYDAVSWAQENGVAAGISETEFAPNKTLSRQELVTMLQKYCEVIDMDINEADTGSAEELENKIDFSKISAWAMNAMKWAFKVGAIAGITEDTIDPLDMVTRAQLAQIIYKIMTYPVSGA